ncbi:MAG: MFS transporter [Candidatus Helarchaeota archaeon]
MERDKVPIWKKISFAIGNIGGLAIGQASILLLYAYYFLYLRVPLTPLEISAILVIYGVWDALNEPIIGHLSDRTKSRFGRRKPYIMLGAIPLIICSFLIFTPPTSDPFSSFIYLTIVLIAFETFVTMVVTNWFSLFPELTLDNKERLSISMFLQIFGVVGLILGIGIAPMIAGSAPTPIAGYSMMGLILGIITIGSMMPTILLIKERKEYQIKEEEKISFFKSLDITFKNKTFFYLVIVQTLLQVSYSLVLSSLPLFFEGILGMGEGDYSILLLITILAVIPSLFLWIKLANNKGTKYALMISMSVFCVAFMLTFLIVNAYIAIIILLIGGIGLGGLMLFPTMLLGDVIDQDQLNTKKRREGIYNGVFGVIVKMSNAVSWGVIGIILTLFNVNRDLLTFGIITPQGELGLRILVGLLPVVVIILGILFLNYYPLSGKKLEDVKTQVKLLNEELAKTTN